MKTHESVEVQRLSDFDGWEFFRIIDPESSDVLYVISVRYYLELDQAEYAVWFTADEDPIAIGNVDCESAANAITDAHRRQMLDTIIDNHWNMSNAGHRHLSFPPP